MKEWLFALTLLLANCIAHTQSSVRSDSNQKFSIQFGGEARLQYLNIKNEGWGEAPPDKTGFIPGRHLLHADFQAGKHFRTFIQLQSSLINGKKITTAADKNTLDVHQAFIELSKNVKRTTLNLRAGRQEIEYGAERLISNRDIPNSRQSFNGVKTGLSLRNTRVDLFLGYPTKNEKGIFDDGINKRMSIRGCYFMFTDIPFIKNIELYYIRYHNDRSRYVDGEGEETRHSTGTRISNNSGKWKYDLEGTYQFGKFSYKTISAWSITAIAGYKFQDMNFKPEISLEAGLISGDDSVGDRRLQTFNPMFPKAAYFGLAALIGPSNLFVIHPELNFQGKSVKIKIQYMRFLRYSKSDCIYGTKVQLLYDDPGKSSKQIGSLISTSLEYTPTRQVVCKAEVMWFNAGQYLKQAGPGKDVLLVGSTIELKF